MNNFNFTQQPQLLQQQQSQQDLLSILSSNNDNIDMPTHNLIENNINNNNNINTDIDKYNIRSNNNNNSNNSENRTLTFDYFDFSLFSNDNTNFPFYQPQPLLTPPPSPPQDELFDLNQALTATTAIKLSPAYSWSDYSSYESHDDETDSIDDNMLDDILFRDDDDDFVLSPKSPFTAAEFSNQLTPHQHAPTFHQHQQFHQEQKVLTATSSSEEDNEEEEEEDDKSRITLITSTIPSSRRRNQHSSSIHRTTRPSQPKKTRRRRSNLMKPGTQLYQFILQLLDDKNKKELIRWETPGEGVFRIMNKEQVSKLWGEQRKRKITYDSLSRGLRHYYSQGLLEAVNKKLHYKFTQKALDEWELIRDKDSIEDILDNTKKTRKSF